MSTTPDMDDSFGPGDELDLAAAEYALGLTGAAERASAETRIAAEPAFAAAVAAWQARLANLDGAYVPVEPPASVKAAIDARLFPKPVAERRPGLLSSLAFWRLTTAAALATALVLALSPGRIEPPVAGPQTRVATILGEGGATFVIVENTADRVRTVSSASPAPPGRDRELWVIADGDAPDSAGILARDGDTRLTLPAGFASDAPLTLAVSVEPEGGSPTGAPTGPVLGAGLLTEI